MRRSQERSFGKNGKNEAIPKSIPPKMIIKCTPMILSRTPIIPALLLSSVKPFSAISSLIFVS